MQEGKDTSKKWYREYKLGASTPEKFKKEENGLKKNNFVSN